MPRHAPKYVRAAGEYAVLLVSMAGFVPKNATPARAASIVLSAALSVWLSRHHAGNAALGLSYFVLGEILYIGFLFLTLPENGLRRVFVRLAGGEEKGYLAFEAVLGFLFFHNSIGLGYVATALPGDLFRHLPRGVLVLAAALLSAAGLGIKMWAAKAVSIEIYYWKDMFLGRKIADFVVSGPYKYTSNPMYGLGQLQAYGFALSQGSSAGLLAALVNQALVFAFYFLAEKKFIARVYGGKS